MDKTKLQTKSKRCVIAFLKLLCAFIFVLLRFIPFFDTAKAQVNCPSGPGWCACVARSGFANSQWVAPTYNRLCRGRRSRPSGINCGGGRYCPFGTTCCNGRCCNSGYYCSKYGCTPNGAIDCGNSYCNPGYSCSSGGGCIPEGKVDCGGGTYCEPGNICSEGKCVEVPTIEDIIIVPDLPACTKNLHPAERELYQILMTNGLSASSICRAIKQGQTQEEKEKRARRKARVKELRRKTQAAAAKRRKQKAARRRAAVETQKSLEAERRRAEVKRHAELARRRAIAERKRKAEIKRQNAIRLERRQRAAQNDRISAELERQKRTRLNQNIAREAEQKRRSGQNPSGSPLIYHDMFSRPTTKIIKREKTEAELTAQNAKDRKERRQESYGVFGTPSPTQQTLNRARQDKEEKERHRKVSEGVLEALSTTIITKESCRIIPLFNACFTAAPGQLGWGKKCTVCQYKRICKKRRFLPGEKCSEEEIAGSCEVKCRL